MFFNKKAAVLTAILGTTIFLPASAELPVPLEEQVQVVQEVQEVDTVKMWDLPQGTYAERYILQVLQERGVTDQYALAVILGNIKQESKFHSNICEGGARVKYSSCRRGGYGLIQWTTSSRYWGLGNHARKIGGDPSSINTQLSYLITEREWKKAKQMFLNPNQSLSYYMKGADIWLGWGVYGNRGYYAQQYYKILYIGQT